MSPLTCGPRTKCPLLQDRMLPPPLPLSTSAAFIAMGSWVWGLQTRLVAFSKAFYTEDGMHPCCASMDIKLEFNQLTCTSQLPELILSQKESISPSKSILYQCCDAYELTSILQLLNTELLLGPMFESTAYETIFGVYLCTDQVRHSLAQLYVGQNDHRG